MEARCRQGANRPDGALERGATRVKPCSFWEPGARKATGTASDRRRLDAAPNWRSVCEMHDPTGEPDAGDPHVRFGGQGVETGLWEPD